MKRTKQILACILTVILMMNFFIMMPIAAEETGSTEDNMAFDVVFVIDGSGSMTITDPNKLAPMSGKLFATLAVAEKSRAGVVVYSHEIRKTSDTLLNLSTEMDQFKKSLDEIEYIPEDDTDIALGLTEGMNLLKRSNATAGGRNPLIILVSDGKTDLPDPGQRSVDESNKELENTLKELEALNIPVYAIGVNANAALVDEPNLKRMADSTGGTHTIINDTKELRDTIVDIFAKHAKIKPQTIGADGKFIIEDESVYAANILIMTDQLPNGYTLTTSSGETISNKELESKKGVDSEEVKETIETAADGNGFTSIKIMYPKPGEWKIDVPDAKGSDDIDISLLTVYDLYLDMETSGTELTTDDQLKATVNLKNNDKEVTDDDLLYGAVAKGTLLTEDGQVVESDMDMPADGNKFATSIDFEKTGRYIFEVTLTGKDNKFIKTAKSDVITVRNAKMVCKDSNVKKTVWYNPFTLGDVIELDDVVSYDKYSEIILKTDKDISENCNLNFDYKKKTITIEPNKTGKIETKVTLVDDVNQSCEFNLTIRVMPAWLIIVAIVLVILLIIGIIILIRRARRPKLQDKIVISMDLPNGYENLTPPEENLILPVGKVEVTLNQLFLLMQNQYAMDSYKNVINQLQLTDVLNAVRFTAGKNGTMILSIPKQFAGRIKVNNINVDAKKGLSKVLEPNGRLTDIVYVMEDQHQQMMGGPGKHLKINIKYGEEPTTFGGGFGGPGGGFGGPGGGFGGPGGGFGGNPGGGFGNPGGGFGNPGSGFGGNPGGGFGGNPGGGFGGPGGGFGGNPGGGFGNPGSGFGNPGNGFGNPGSDFGGNPGSGFGNPGGSFGNPGNGFGNPGNGFGNPGSGFGGNPGSDFDRNSGNGFGSAGDFNSTSASGNDGFNSMDDDGFNGF